MRFVSLKYHFIAFISVMLFFCKVVIAQIPANDNCLNAAPIACGSVINGTTVNATNEAIPPGCFVNNTAPSVWYTFTGDGSNVVLGLCLGTAFDTQLALYTGTCGALICNSSNDDSCGLQSQLTFTTVAGVVYFVRVFGYFGSSGPFQISMTCTSSVVPNETCATAINLTCPQIVNGSTFGAANDVIPNGCFVTNTGPGVWYSFTGDGSNITASLCGSTYDTQIAILTGSCAAFTCVGYNDQFCGNQSEITITSVAGTVYYIYVFGFFAANGTFTLSLNCAPPPPPPCLDLEPNGCPDIDLGLDIVIPICTDPCTPVTLTAQYFETGTTSSYTACSVPYAPYPYNTGTGFSIGIDDVYTPIVNLPFNFCFFGTSYSQCIVGSNGVISFNTAAASGYCPWGFVASCPSPALPLNSIFGAYHDIDPSVFCGAVPCGDARYASFGIAPCRVFVVSFDNVPHFSFACNGLRTSCEIVLYETTNVIEVFIENKPVCPTWNGGRALIGIQNATGTVGFSPSTRNTGVWTAVNEGWRFVPNGPSNVMINWYEQGNPLGTGASINVCPTIPNQTYAATVTYTRCDASTVVVSDDVIVTCSMLVVPIEWKSFEVMLSNDERFVDCHWTTASELNNDYFTIERSFDGAYWQQIGRVDGSGTSYLLNSYDFRDKEPLNGLSYYRIVQTDFNGTESASTIQSIQKSIKGSLSVFPNPSKDKLIVNPWKASYQSKLIDNSGREINISWSPTGQTDTSELFPGVYILEIIDTSNGEVHHVPIVVSR